MNWKNELETRPITMLDGTSKTFRFAAPYWMAYDDLVLDFGYPPERLLELASMDDWPEEATFADRFESTIGYVYNFLRKNDSTPHGIA